ncbi:MAG TPA: putative sulfate exporter family transporter [Gemmatimonadaceae bacterium]|nr:putative sulfate exporter family transporter [Gemmatimonadaceae bacterium]
MSAPALPLPAPPSPAGQAVPRPPRRPRAAWRALVPGVGLAVAVAIASQGIAALETRVLGHPVIEGLVVAILLGMVLRTSWTPPARTEAGIHFTGKQVLEVAVFLLGASVDLPLLLQAGPALAAGIVLLVVFGIAASYGIGRAVGLPRKLAILVACGNSICGNSAIAAIAPVIGARKEHVASAIAFTAILGVVVVVGLPLLRFPLGFDDYQYGVLAGLTVYAVPQVLAAAFPVSVLAGQVGTLVKLVRVLMLGPVVLVLAVWQGGADGADGADGAEGAEGATARGRGAPPRITRSRRAPASASSDARRAHPLRLARFVPWFIVGFLALAVLRSVGAIPAAWVGPTRALSTWLTVAAMAALGLGVDLRAIRRVGVPVVATVTASLALLIVLGVTLIRLLRIG